MKLKYFVLAGAVLLIASRLDFSYRAPTVAPRASAPTATVTRNLLAGRASVVDGDTLILEDRRRIRLFGIDAPESAQTCLDGTGQRYRCGARAAEALASLLGRNGRVTCEARDLDRYGRTVAECRTDAGTDLNREMVRTGWAIDYQRYSRGRFGAEQRDAQIARRGIWVGSFDAPAQWRKMHHAK
ncbi:MAG: thermonuclease family protein [Sphingobium sp.]